MSYKENMSFSKPTTKALFLDRDGIIIEDAGYTKDPHLVKLIPSIVPLIKAAQEKHYEIIIVTNQSGIGRGLISVGNYTDVTHRMLELLSEQGALHISHIYFAPYYEKATQIPLSLNQPYQIENPWNIPHVGIWSENWRKPNLGMISFAETSLNIDLSQSLIVGDRWTDQLLAVNSNLKKGAWYCSRIETLEENSEFLAHQDEKSEKISIVHDLTSVIDFLD
jgi:D-glycero-D-manno-heptose 1,7-bisphosphate phosphatase